MSIFGLMLIDPDQLLFWADTEIFERDAVKANGVQPKLACNPFISAVGGGCGVEDLAQAADAIVFKAKDFDTLPNLISAALRRKALEIASYFDRNGSNFSGQRYVIGGWSVAHHRMLGWSFSGEDFFAPQLAGSFCSPELDVPEHWRPQNGNEIVEAANKQVLTLRERGPSEAGSGALLIAHIRRGALNVQTIPDYFMPPKETSNDTGCPTRTVLQPVANIGHAADAADAGTDGEIPPLHSGWNDSVPKRAVRGVSARICGGTDIEGRG